MLTSKAVTIYWCSQNEDRRSKTEDRRPKTEDTYSEDYNIMFDIIKKWMKVTVPGESY